MELKARKKTNEDDMIENTWGLGGSCLIGRLGGEGGHFCWDLLV